MVSTKTCNLLLWNQKIKLVLLVNQKIRLLWVIQEIWKKKKLVQMRLYVLCKTEELNSLKDNLVAVISYMQLKNRDKGLCLKDKDQMDHLLPTLQTFLTVKYKCLFNISKTKLNQLSLKATWANITWMNNRWIMKMLIDSSNIKRLLSRKKFQ